jgi:predicted enzyme related to lactoylglutathione lyase
VDGIATTQGGRVAWCEDSEGNILGLAQTNETASTA